MDKEVLKLKQLIKSYVYFERNNSHKKQAILFYTKCTSFFGTESARNDVPVLENQLKELKEVRNRFWKNYSPTNNKKDAHDFHKYFYQKFLNEIRLERKRTTGVAYSQRSAKFVDSKLGRN